jgi:single-stranded-DNA-specific exonuclease
LSVGVARRHVDPEVGGELLVERSVTGKSWRLAAERPDAARSISQQFGLPEVVGRVLAARGMAVATVPGFLEPRLRDWLPDPSHLLDLDRAVERLAAAAAAGERVGIIGDYDVDGATSTALVRRYLEAVGCPVEVRIPDRLTEGYGPNDAAFATLADAGCRLVLCLDNGTTAHAPLAAAAARGLEVIVVDHHAAETELPAALAVINPNRKDQASALGDLAAVGVAFVLMVALNRALRSAGHFASRVEPDLMAALDLVALGTVCDVVPLTGLNRAFVVQGIKIARQGRNPGLAAMALVAGIETIDDARKFGFILGPRLNAGGRMGESQLGAALLVTEDPAIAAELAGRLDLLNTTRQALERETLEAALRAVEPQLRDDQPLLVAAGEGWHAGVIGIVAARLVERFARPALAVALERGVGKGSGRSIAGFDLGAAVIAARAAGLIEAGGGHPMAAGLTVDVAQLPALQAFLCRRLAATMALSGPAESRTIEPGRAELRVDGALSLAAVNTDLARKLLQLAPFGAGHDEPRFVLDATRVMQARPVGRGHVSCLLAGPAGPAVRGIAFRSADTGLDRALLGGGALRVVGRIRLDSYQGRERAGLEIEDAAPLG